MSGIIDELRQGEAPGPERIRQFLNEHEFPKVEGNVVTFVFLGQADHVRMRHWIFGLPSGSAFERLPDTDLWYHVLEIPENSRIEYKIEVEQGGQFRWILDPLNPNRAHDPFGANSVCHSSGYSVPDWIDHDPSARQGSIESFELPSEALSSERSINVYLPARFRRRARYPLLVAHDGDDYLRFSSFKTVLDNLIHRLEIPSMIVALSNPGDRLAEYADSENHARHIVEELVPRVESLFPLVGTPQARGLMGASFGAVASLSTAWRYPGFFGKLLLQSGSFGFTDIGDHQRGPAFDPVVKFINAFRAAPGEPAHKLFMSCGTYESLIYENRSMAPVMQRTGMEVRFTEARDGHNWENWRDRLREGLSWLFPGPQWMVYE